MRNKKILIITGLTILVAIIVGLVSNQHRFTAFRSTVEALGLHGTAKVSRPLSKTQVERLESHFLDFPIAPASSSGSGPAAQTLSQVEAINKLNARQVK